MERPSYEELLQQNKKLLVENGRLSEEAKKWKGKWFATKKHLYDYAFEIAHAAREQMETLEDD